MWNAIFNAIKHSIRKEQFTSILAHLNENGIGKLTRPNFPAGAKNVVWKQDWLVPWLHYMMWWNTTFSFLRKEVGLACETI